ncbi:hypothetical protein RCL_jg28433.t1 [Rhizophagus clarus]|uniref:Uncharacterized protein n=1 Tax=Rhizophagus clarus TaxID=94130 RepID=A0A8H3M8R3_9GLOM|nr:hypothetical protein RCL_jg28433.t1 [Rhizophagus clarus]
MWLSKYIKWSGKRHIIKLRFIIQLLFKPIRAIFYIINYNSFFFVFNIEVDLQFYNVSLQDTYKLFLISSVIYGGTLVDNKNIKDLYQLLIPINLTIPYRIV